MGGTGKTEGDGVGNTRDLNVRAVAIIIRGFFWSSSYPRTGGREGERERPQRSRERSVGCVLLVFRERRMFSQGSADGKLRARSVARSRSPEIIAAHADSELRLVKTELYLVGLLLSVSFYRRVMAAADNANGARCIEDARVSTRASPFQYVLHRVASRYAAHRILIDRDPTPVQDRAFYCGSRDG